MDQKNSIFGHFSRSEKLNYPKKQKEGFNEQLKNVDTNDLTISNLTY